MRPETFMIMSGPAIKEAVSGKAVSSASTDSSADPAALLEEKNSFHNQLLTTLSINETREGTAIDPSDADLPQEGTKLSVLNESTNGELSEVNSFDLHSPSHNSMEGLTLETDDSVIKPGGTVLQRDDTALDYLKTTTGKTLPAEPAKGPPGTRASDLPSRATEGSETGNSVEGISTTGETPPVVGSSLNITPETRPGEEVQEISDGLSGQSSGAFDGREDLLTESPIPSADISGYLQQSNDDAVVETTEEFEDLGEHLQVKKESGDAHPVESHNRPDLFSTEAQSVELPAELNKEADNDKSAPLQNSLQSASTDDDTVEGEQTVKANPSEYEVEAKPLADTALTEADRTLIAQGETDELIAKNITDTDRISTKRVVSGDESKAETNTARRITGSSIGEEIQGEADGATFNEASQGEGAPDKSSPEDLISARKPESHSSDMETGGRLEGNPAEFKVAKDYGEEQKPLPSVKNSGTDISKDSQVISGEVRSSNGVEVVKERPHSSTESKTVTDETHIDETLEAQEGEGNYGETRDSSDDSMDEALQDDFKEMEANAPKPALDSDIDSLLTETLKGKDGKGLMGAATAIHSEEVPAAAPDAGKVTTRTLFAAPQGVARHQGAYISKSLESFFVKGVAARVSVAFTENIGKATITLNPPELGRLKVEMSLQDNVMQATFRAENLNVKEALEKNIDLLKAALIEQGMKVDELNVSLDDNYRERDGRFTGESSGRQGRGKGDVKGEVSFNRDGGTEDQLYYSAEEPGVDVFI